MVLFRTKPTPSPTKPHIPTKPIHHIPTKPSPTPSYVRLRQLAIEGDAVAVGECLNQGVKMVPDRDGRTALHFAALHGHVSVARVLLESNACQVNAVDKVGYTPLHRACLTGNTTLVRTLLLHGSEPNTYEFVQSNTPLHDVAYHGHAECLEELLRNKAAVYVRNKRGSTPLHLCAARGHVQCCTLLLQQGCRVDVADKYDDTPLHSACRHGHTAIAHSLLTANARLEAVNKNGDTPLHLAVAQTGSQPRRLIKLLLETGANVRARNRNGDSPLSIAERTEQFELHTLMQSTVRTANRVRVHGTWSGRKSKIRERLAAVRENGLSPQANWQLLFQDWPPQNGACNSLDRPKPACNGPDRPACNGLDRPACNGLDRPACDSLDRSQPASNDVDRTDYSDQNRTPPACNAIDRAALNCEPQSSFFRDLAGKIHRSPASTPCSCGSTLATLLARHNTAVNVELLEEIDAAHDDLMHTHDDYRHSTDRKIANLDHAVKDIRIRLNQTTSYSRRTSHKLLKALQQQQKQQHCSPTRLVRSKSESELDTDAEQTNNSQPQRQRNQHGRQIQHGRRHRPGGDLVVRTSVNGAIKTTSPPVARLRSTRQTTQPRHSNSIMTTSLHERFETSVRAFNGCGDTSTDRNSFSSLTSQGSDKQPRRHRTQCEGAVHRKLEFGAGDESAKQRHLHRVSITSTEHQLSPSALSQTQSFQQSLDSGYGTGPHIVAEAALTTRTPISHQPMLISTETQTEEDTSYCTSTDNYGDDYSDHEYTELEGYGYSPSKTTYYDRPPVFNPPPPPPRDRIPPPKPLPPPPTKPLPPLPRQVSTNV